MCIRDRYKIKPNIFDSQGGLPNTKYGDGTQPQPLLSPNITNIFDANIDDPPFNQGGLIGFDPENQYIGLETPIDLIGFQGSKSPSPMDNNWGGIKYTNTQIGTSVNTNENISTPNTGITTQLQQNSVSITKDNSQNNDQTLSLIHISEPTRPY